MKRIPNAREVEKALRLVRSAVKDSLKQLNQVAGEAMAKGNYALGESLAGKGREIQEFEGEVDALRNRWRELRRRGRGPSSDKEATTPLWAYYQPTLKALCEAGGEASRAELEPIVEQLLTDELQPGDHAAMARGKDRWQVMIQRARKHLVEERWIEDRTGVVWRITKAGRKAASARATRS